VSHACLSAAVSSRSGVEKLDFEFSIGDRSRLSNQLIQAWLRNRAETLFVDITSMAHTRRLSIDRHLEDYTSSARGRSHDEVEIARMKPVCDSPAGGVQHGILCVHRPFTGKRPLIKT
jgi:hypothetical protein